MLSPRAPVFGMLGMLTVGLIVGGAIWWRGHALNQGLPAPVAIVKYKAIERPTPPPNDYVGGAACRLCHQLIWDRYQSHPMSHSAALIDEASPLEDFDQHPSYSVATPIGTLEYRVDRNSEGQFHCESLNDPVLGQIYDQRVQVSFAIGSGHHGRSYVLAKDDHLFMSPIGWYSQVSKWDMSPNYPPGNHPRFERRIVQACIVCHTDQVSITRDQPDQFPAPSIPAAAISCERCHGPGAGHIEFHEHRSKLAHASLAVMDTIINPAKLDHERRESVCWQCHFSGEERIPRYGRIDADFRPGMHFDDIWVTFVRGTRIDPDGSMRVVSHVEQTQASVCFQRSEGRFGCISCHDPHFSPAPAEKEAFYREKCLVCHADRGCSVPLVDRTKLSAADSCANCHLPSRGLNTVPHTSQTDHRVLRNPRIVSETSKDIPLVLFQTGDRSLPELEQDRAWGLVLAKDAERKQDVKLAREAEQKLSRVQLLLTDDMQVLEWLGVAEQLLELNARARSHWLQMLEKNPRDEQALRRLGDLYLAESDFGAARDAFVRYLEINPWHSNYQVRLAAVHGRSGNLEAAIECAVKALRINPSLAWAYRLLSDIYQLQGNQAESRRMMKLFQRLELPK